MKSEKLVNIVKEYFYIDKGVMIEDPNYLIQICKLSNRNTVSISRRSVKHFTESRKGQLYKYDREKQLEIILSITEDILPILLSPDVVYKNEKRENSLVYIKKIDDIKTPRAIVLEVLESKYQIVSIHLVKVKDYLDIMNKIKNN